MTMAAAETLNPDRIGAFSQKKTGRIIAEGDSNHGSYNKHREIAQHDNPASEEPFAITAHDPIDHPACGGIASAQLGEGIALQ